MWCFGLRGAAVRLVKAAGLSPQEPTGQGIATILTWSARARRRWEGRGLSDREIVLRAAVGLADSRDAALLLASGWGVPWDRAFGAVCRLAAEAAERIAASEVAPIRPAAAVLAPG